MPMRSRRLWMTAALLAAFASPGASRGHELMRQCLIEHSGIVPVAESDGEAWFEQAEALARRSPGEVAAFMDAHPHAFDQARRIQVAKAIALSRDAAWRLPEEIREFGIEDPDALLELARILAPRARSLAKHVADFGIRDEAARIEIAKAAAGAWPEEVAQNIARFEIRGPGAQQALSEIALKIAQSHGRAISEHIGDFGIVDEATRGRIALEAASNDGAGTARFVRNYGIRDERDRVEIAKRAVAQDTRGASESIDQFEIRSPESLYEVAVAAASQGRGIHRFLDAYGVRTEAQRVEIAKIYAARHGGDVSASIQKFRISGASDRIEIAELAAASDGGGTSENIQRYGITDQGALIRIALIAARSDGAGLSRHIGKYGIRNPEVRARIAKEAARKNGIGVLKFVRHYDIHDPKTLREIAGIALRSAGQTDAVDVSYVLENCDFDEKSLRALLKHHPISVLLQLARKSSGSAGRMGTRANFRKFLKQVASERPDLLPPKWINKLLWERIDSQEVGVGLLKQAYRQLEARGQLTGDLQKQPWPAHDSATLLGQAVGLDPALASRIQSLPTRERTLLYQLLLDIQEGLDQPALQGIRFDPDLFATAHGAQELSSLLQRLRDLLHLRGNSDRAWDETVAKLDLRRRGVDLAGIGPLKKSALAAANQDLQALLGSDGSAAGRPTSFTEEQFDRLHDEWNGLDPLFTLFARYNGKADWKKEIPVLAKVVRASLGSPEDFESLKFKGDPGSREDQDQARAQLAMLTEPERAEWMKPRAHASVVDSGTRSTIVLSALSSDPKLMLAIGDCVDTYSCLSPANGIKVQALPGYVIDANVRALLSFALTPEHFEKPSDFETVRSAIASGKLQADWIAFDGNRRVARFSLPGAPPVTSLPLGNAHLRQIIKIGKKADAGETAGDGSFPQSAVVAEKDYEHPHPALERMKQQQKLVLRQLAEGTHSVIGGAIWFPASRNPMGVYSDWAHGEQTSPYTIQADP